MSVKRSRKPTFAPRLPDRRHTSELQSPCNLVCRLLLEKKNAYLAGSLARDARSLAEIDNRLGEAQHRAAPVIADREQAVANLDYLSGFAKLDPYSPQLSVLARVAENLPSNGAQLAAWSYQAGDLQFTIFSPASSLDILFYVKTYSSVPVFKDVAAERAEGPRSLRVKLHLAK